MGLQFAVAVALGTAAGYWLDTKWRTRPFLMLLGLLTGAAAGFLNIYRAVYATSKRDQHDAK